ncbi:MAG: TonB-dependent receptor [Bacteroidales bacterium]
MKRQKTQFLTGGAKALSLSVMVLFFVMSISTTSAWAQTDYSTLKGVVLERDTKDVPVEFATVQVLPQGSVTVTNTKGEFSFERLSPGKVNIKIDFLGMETIDTTLSLAPGSVTTLNFKMQQSSFRLEEVSVVAQESKAGKATASNISRQAMDHLQTSSLSDIMQLLPGGVTSNSSLSSAKTFSIRSIEGTNMNSMGTSIVIDGSPLSNNANLQTLSPAISGGGGAVSGGSSPNSGLDIRSISTDNIESIEVIRGIPSVEYGDLTSGAVLIKSKAGKEPLTIRFKTDPRIYQTSISKGINLGDKRGSINISGDYAYSVTDVTESYSYYQRATAKALYSNVFGNLSTNTSLDFSLGVDTREKNPDDQRTQLETGAKDIGVRFNTNGIWNINRGWLNNIKYTLSASYRDKHSFSQQLLGNAFAAYSMADRDGAVLSNRPGQKVYDNNGQELTNIRSGENNLYATFLPYEYFSRYDIYGDEINVFAKINATFSKRTGNVSNRIVVGADFKTDGNLGDGKVYDLENPPYRNLSAENSSPRPRKYSSIPFINQVAVYVEENLSLTLGEREFIAQVGGRFDLVNGKSALTPRTNFSFDIIPSKLWIRGGYGVTSKAPSTLYLYPENAYFDFVHFNSLDDSSIPDAEKLFLASTRVYGTGSQDLKIATNEKSELGLDFRVKKMRFSVTGYNENLKNGYTLGKSIENFQLIEYITYEKAVETPGSIPTLQPKDTSNVFISYSTPMNSVRSHNRGVEFDFDFGRFDAIRTSFVLNGAYMRSTDWTDNNSFGTNSNLNSLEKHIGVYEKATVKSEKERFTTSLRVTHNIPSIGFVFTATAQVNWLNKYWSDYGNDTMFVSYISHEDGKVRPFDPAKKDDPEFAYMFSSKSSTRHIAQSYFPTLLINFHLTKEIGENIKASFYVNNLVNNRPLYESKSSPGSFTRLNIPIYFGFELSVRIK